ncbi:multiheme c-type cytochrome [Desulfurivibrio sp. D14AmB]|uniref:multiheme c-type cytochrome n=1 Tax=Desulfurivibrio sp. D14AmB TaxID=3374370 RepID=UPI00376F1A22
MRKTFLIAAMMVAGFAGTASAKEFMTWQTPGFTGPETCKMCHSDIHGQWSSSWHTMKTEWGPAHPEVYLSQGDQRYPWGKEKVYPWVKRDWDKLDTYMILDRKDANTNYVAIDKVALNEVDLVVGSQRKQRYAVYYDGGARKAWLATTQDRGISWTLDRTKVVDYPGNKERAGYKFLFIEVRPKDGDINKSNYGTWRSWQEQCIACHGTGFDADAFYKAKEEYVAGKREHLRDTFVASVSISCEACHGGGAAHAKKPSQDNIINPAKLTDPAQRMVTCNRCHTRAQTNTMHGKGSNDNRGFILGEHSYEDVMQYTRPAWGKGNRQTSIDGKGRRDHQQDMDIMLSATIKGSHSVHANMACFDCHNAHQVGNNPEYPWTYTPKEEACIQCHGAQTTAVLKVMDGRTGWPRYGYGNWDNEGGRVPNKQHIFNLDAQGRSFGLAPEQYHWALKQGGNPKNEADWLAIWPWEKGALEAQGQKVAIGAAPWQ